MEDELQLLKVYLHERTQPSGQVVHSEACPKECSTGLRPHVDNGL